jgi:hypothetical protein
MRLSNAVAIAALIAMVAFSTVLSAGSASEFTEESIWMLPDTETDFTVARNSRD